MTIKAKDSRQVEKVRKKLEKVLQEEQSHFNNETLNEMRNSIHKWLNRHEPERESTEEKTFTLFDENKHSSEIKSKFVLNLLQELKTETDKEKEKLGSLAGRVTHQSKNQSTSS